MRKILFYIISSLIVGLLSNCYVSENQITPNPVTASHHEKLSLSLSLNNDTFSLIDNVVATLILKNETEEILAINRRMAPNDLLSIQAENPLGEVAFVIKDPNGMTLDFNARVNMRFPREVDFAQLAPDKFIAFSYDLSTYYIPLNSLGKYSIQAIYHNEAKPDNIEPVFTGKIFSNIIYFEVDN